MNAKSMVGTPHFQVISEAILVRAAPAMPYSGCKVTYNYLLNNILKKKSLGFLK
jgi:hypothetical protein